MCCIGTGPSLTPQQVDTARAKGFVLFGCNRVWELTDLDVLYCCNETFWDHYWCDDLAKYRASKWTGSKVAADRYGLNWINGYDRPGLSVDPAYVHHGHGSGFSLVNLAYLMGARRIVLLGYDMRYAADYSGQDKRVGSSPRHYFGEYPSALHHWPSVSVRGGVHVGLVAQYESVAKQGLVEVINATPAGALTCFPTMDIHDVSSDSN